MTSSLCSPTSKTVRKVTGPCSIRFMVICDDIGATIGANMPGNGLPPE
ncbi:hypothetical protein [Streptomyces sp. NBC_01235]|nr:hypothetical protein OG289_01495 [Streptomyces sp. NBC_01235]